MTENAGPWKPAGLVDAHQIAGYLNRAEMMKAACHPEVQKALGVSLQAWPRSDFSSYIQSFLGHEHIAPRSHGSWHFSFPTDQLVLVHSVEVTGATRIGAGAGYRRSLEGSGEVVGWVAVRPREHFFVEVWNDTDEVIPASALKLHGYVLKDE